MIVTYLLLIGYVQFLFYFFLTFMFLKIILNKKVKVGNLYREKKKKKLKVLHF